MNPEKLLEIAAEAIQQRPAGMVAPWQLCYLDGRVQCVSTHCMKKPEIVFFTFSEDSLQNGFTSNQWARIRKSMARFWEVKKL